MRTSCTLQQCDARSLLPVLCSDGRSVEQRGDPTMRVSTTIDNRVCLWVAVCAIVVAFCALASLDAGCRSASMS